MGANGKSDASQMEANAEVTDEAEPTAEDWRIAECFDQGLDIAEIVRRSSPPVPSLSASFGS